MGLTKLVELQKFELWRFKVVRVVMRISRDMRLYEFKADRYHCKPYRTKVMQYCLVICSMITLDAIHLFYETCSLILYLSRDMGL